eukprot:SAG11_NODE_7613_length_1121_cov_1.134051_1_plen_116_part_10
MNGIIASHSEGAQGTLPSHFINIRFVGVGFRAYVVKKKVASSLSLQESVKEGVSASKDNDLETDKFSLALTNTFADQEDNFFRFLMLKVGQSALTAYPIPKDIKVYCPKDQQADKD